MAGKKMESAVEDWAVVYAWQTYGWETAKLNPLGQIGIPDRIFWVHGGRPVLIEFKRKGKKPRKIQAHRIEELRGWGYDVETCDNREDAKDILDRYASIAGATKTLGAPRLPNPSRSLLPKKRVCSYLGRPRSR